MNEFEITSLVISVLALTFAIWVKPTKKHHHSVK